MSAQQLNNLLKDYGQSIQMDHLALDANCVCSLYFDSALLLHISYNEGEDELHLTSGLVSTISRHDVRIYEMLLIANTDWRARGGGFFSIDPLSDTFLYNYHEPMGGLDYPRFYQLLERFVLCLSSWRSRLEALSVETLTSQPLPSSVIPGANIGIKV